MPGIMVSSIKKRDYAHTNELDVPILHAIVSVDRGFPRFPHLQPPVSLVELQIFQVLNAADFYIPRLPISIDCWGKG